LKVVSVFDAFFAATSAPSIGITMKVFQNNKINWKESQMHGVIRRLKSRQHWDKRWEE
jgi:hypothetical protein